MSWIAGDPKLAVKRAIQQRMPSSFPPILVASMGRSGSTFIHDALVTGMARARFGTTWKPMLKLCRAPAFELGETQFAAGVVYKTHAYPAEISSSRLPRVVFVFSTPSDAALSAIASAAKFGESWISKHFAHLRANGTPDEILSRDALRFRDQMDAWLTARDLDVLAIRYETLWNHANALMEFIGFSISLPSRRARTAYDVLDQRTKNLVLANYKAMDEEFAAYPDLILNERSIKPGS